MSDWLNTALSACLRPARAILPVPYTKTEIRKIEEAGTQVAFNMIEKALREKIATLNLNCPLTRTETSYSTTITLEIGDLNGLARARSDNAKLVLQSVDKARYLASSLKGDVGPNGPAPDIARFKILCRANGPDSNNPYRFQDFFKAIGISDSRSFSDMQDAFTTSFKPGDTQWVGRTAIQNWGRAYEGFDFDYGHVFCPTAGFLQAIDVKPAEFARAVTEARLAQASQFQVGPVRQGRQTALSYGRDYT